MPKRLTNYDWTRKLAQPVDLGGSKPVRTLADVREHLMRLPEGHQQRPAFQHVASLILDAAEGKDVGDISVALRISQQALRAP